MRGEDAKFTLTELTGAYEHISTLKSASFAAPSIFLNMKDAMVFSSLALFGLSLRQTAHTQVPAPDERAQVYRRLRKAFVDELVGLVGAGPVIGDPENLRMRRVLFATLRIQVLRGYGQLLLACAQQLKHRPSRRNIEAGLEALTEASEVLLGLYTGCTNARWESGTKQRYLELLTSELREGHLLDAWSGCYLQLVACEDCDDSQAAGLLNSFVKYICLLDTLVRDGPKFLTKTKLHAATPYLQYLLTQQTVQALALLDGGSTYGLPEGAPRVPVFTPTGKLIRAGASTPSIVDASGIFLAIEWYGWQRRDALTGATASAASPQSNDRLLAALPPLRLDAMFELSVRAARAAIATLKAQLTVTGGRLQRSRGPQLQLDRDQGEILARTTLAAAHNALVHSRAGLVPESPWRRVDAERLCVLWQTYVQALGASLDVAEAVRGSHGRSGTGDLEGDISLGDRFEDLHGAQPWFESPTTHDLPTDPCAVVRALLSSGAIPLYERLLRAKSNNVPLFGTASNWPELLLFGRRGELESLVDASSSFLRRMVGLMGGLPSSQAGERRLDAYLRSDPHVVKRVIQLARAMTWLGAMFNVDRLCALAPQLGAAIARRRERSTVDGGSDHGGGDGSGGSTEAAAASAGGPTHDTVAPAGDAGAVQGPGPAEAASFRARSFVALWGAGAEDMLTAQSHALRFWEGLARACNERLARQDIRALLSLVGPDAILPTLMYCQLLLVAYALAPAASAPNAGGADRTARAATDSAAEAVTAETVAAELKVLLLRGVDLMGLIGAAASLLGTGSPTNPELGRCFHRVLWVTCLAFPHELRAALVGGPASPPRSGGGGEAAAAAAASSRLLPRLEAVLGPRGVHPESELLVALHRVAEPWVEPPVQQTPDLGPPAMVAAARLFLP